MDLKFIVQEIMPPTFARLILLHPGSEGHIRAAFAFGVSITVTVGTWVLSRPQTPAGAVSYGLEGVWPPGGPWTLLRGGQRAYSCLLLKIWAS